MVVNNESASRKTWESTRRTRDLRVHANPCVAFGSRFAARGTRRGTLPRDLKEGPEVEGARGEGVTRATRDDTWSRPRTASDKGNVPSSGVVEVASDHYHVSRLLNFLVTTLPMSMPRRSTIRWARSGCEVPLKTLMFGILLCKTRTRELSKFARNKLLARTGCDTGITTTETTGAVGQSVIARVPDVTSLDHAPPTRAGLP